MRAETRFSLSFLVFALVFAAMLALFNVVVDPYLVFGRPRVAGFNDFKPAVATRERLMKAYDAPRHGARTVILGSSRTDVGFNPASPAWPAAAQPVYNLSLASADTRGLLRYFQHMVALGHSSPTPRTILLGLDFENSLVLPGASNLDRSTHRPTDTEDRMALLEDGAPNPGRLLRVAKDYVTATLSLDATTDSIASIVESNRGSSPNLEPNGHLAETGFLTLVTNDGVSNLFAQNNRQFISNYGDRPRVLNTTGSVQSIDAVLDFARRQDIKVILFVQPAHADRLELIDKLGYWAAFEEWKRILTKQVERSRSQGADVALWDFGGYEAFVLEPVPDPTDRQTRLRWFWEPAHYTTALGDKMIRRMMQENTDSTLGVKLSPDTIEGTLSAIRSAREAYRQAATSATERLSRLLPR